MFGFFDDALALGSPFNSILWVFPNIMQFCSSDVYRALFAHYDCGYVAFSGQVLRSVGECGIL